MILKFQAVPEKKKKQFIGLLFCRIAVPGESLICKQRILLSLRQNSKFKNYRTLLVTDDLK